MPAIQFSGLASGIDSSAIISSLMEARAVSKVPHENKLAENKNEKTALEEVNTRLLKLKSALADFMTLAGGSVSKKASSSNTDMLAASAGNVANTGSYSVTVNNLARSATLSFDDRYTSKTAVLAGGLTSDGTIDFVVGQGSEQKTYSVTVTSTTTLAELSDKINSTAGERLQSTIVNAGTEANPEYLLMVNGLETGLEKGELAVNVSANIQALGVFTGNTLEQAENAEIDIAGIGTVRRSQNTITDVIPGLTLDLKVESAIPVIVGVSSDADKTSEKVEQIVSALNDVIAYSKENSKITRDENGTKVSNVYGTLAKTGVDEQAISDIRTAIDSSTTTTDTAVKIFADMGITIQRDGTYQFDREKFKTAVNSSPVAVNQLLTSFADDVASTSGVINEYTKFQGIFGLSITANETEDKRAQEAIERIERSMEQQKATLTQIFANLESTVGRLNSGAQFLLSSLQSLPRR